MLDEMRARDVALIRDATIDPAPGLTVLTGETGAGKSALLSALKLLVGERADATAVREGAPSLEVVGRFFVRGGDPDGVVVRRRVSADGRGRVEIDGSPASVRELAAGVGTSVDLCGQHEHQRLLDARTHVEILDAWAGEGVSDALAAYDAALDEARATARALREVREASRQTDERLDEARFALERIDEVHPAEGEYEQLREQLPRAEHAEALMEAALGARSVLTGDAGVQDGLAGAARSLRSGASFDPELGRQADRLEADLADVDDVAETLRGYAEGVDFEPGELERLQGRLAALEGLMRRFGPTMDDVMRRRDEAARVVGASEDGGLAEREALSRAKAAERALRSAADALDAARAEAAPRLSEAVTAQMGRLRMGGASVEVSQERLPREQWTRQGPSHVEFLYRSGSGLTPRPLRRIASGGEVSRVMLAVKVVLGDSDGCDTLVFDEVDAGVGGATAVALAAVLADLARTHQVIVVTHLAQVAVVAERHYLVSKSAGERPETTIEEIAGEERVREVARMLSGDLSEASLAHAREMLAEAAGA